MGEMKKKEKRENLNREKKKKKEKKEEREMVMCHFENGWEKIEQSSPTQSGCDTWQIGFPFI